MELCHCTFVLLKACREILRWPIHGSHAAWKVLESSRILPFSSTWKVLEINVGSGKFSEFDVMVLESS